MKKFLSILTAALVLTASSCKKDYLELNKNPNAPSVTTPQLALSGALKTSADIVNGGGYVQYASWMGYLSWSTSFQANVALLSYQITPNSYDVWTPLYQNITNYDALRKSTTEPYFQAISEIMTVFDYQALVDNYNNIAYTDAIKGTAVLTPKYDKGSDVYDAILKRLDAAIVQIQTGQKAAIVPTSPGSSDIMYGGDMTKWLKFANTLKLRIALRQSMQSSLSTKTASLKAAVAATQALGYIDNNSPGYVNPGYLNSDAFNGQQSPLWRNYGTTQNGGVQTNRNQYQANSYGATKLTANGDTRGYKVYTTTGTNVITATALGVTTPPAVAPSKVGTGLLQSPTQSAIVISPSESYFLQAEGIKNGYITAGTLTAQQAYNAGVTASFTYLGVAADAAAYLTANPYPVAGSDAAQEQAIINEKWKALAVYGAFEAFNEFRRTGYPNDIPLSVYPGANPPNQVTRIPYPQVEYTTNPGSVAGEGNISVFTSKIFWAK